MRTINRMGTTIAVIGVLTMTGCETIPDTRQSSPSQTSASGNVYAGTGVVEAIDVVDAGKGGIAGSGFGIGTIAGAVIGGVLGNQVGGGTGRTVATVAGAAGGAYAGHEIEKSRQSANAYRFSVRMDDGSYQTVTQGTSQDIRVGDRVRIESGTVRRQ